MKRSQMVKKLATTIENSKVANISSKVLADSLLAECEKNGMLPATTQSTTLNIFFPNTDVLQEIEETLGYEFTWEPESN